ncbi:MAG: hypothetical protein Q9213_007160 [Squamulea squamosa]
MSIWNPGHDGILRRATRMSNTIPGMSRFPQGVLLAQHRIERIILDSLAEYSNIVIQRNVQPTSIAYDHSGAETHAITVQAAQVKRKGALHQDATLESNKAVKANGEEYRGKLNGHSEIQSTQEVIKAKYLIGCDGAHSWTRRQLGFQMEGEQSEYIWGVLGHDKRFDRSQINPDMILDAAQRIMHPYYLRYRHCDWWTVYQIGQRVGTQFSAHNRIFLAGDAIHTHSPKAGQGMNVSMQDCYNLGWKLGLVIKGIAKPSILTSYESERRAFAKELIEFDQTWSRLWSKSLAKGAADDAAVPTDEFQQAFQKQRLFSSGTAVEYAPNSLIAGQQPIDQQHDQSGRAKQHLANKVPLGQRFPSFQAIKHCDARPWRLGTLLKADGRFHIVLFAGDVSKTEQMQRVHGFAGRLVTSAVPLLQRCVRNGGQKAVYHTVNILTIHSAPRQEVELSAFPDLLFPFDEDEGWDYDRIFVDEGSYHEGHGKAYENYGVDPVRGCVVVVRPDQHVAWIGDLEDGDSMEQYFKNFLVAPQSS